MLPPPRSTIAIAAARASSNGATRLSSTAAQCTKPGTRTPGSEGGQGQGQAARLPRSSRRMPMLGPGFLLVSLAMVAFGIWVAVDASKYPDWAFQQARTQKWLFQILTPI